MAPFVVPATSLNSKRACKDGLPQSGREHTSRPFHAVRPPAFPFGGMKIHRGNPTDHADGGPAARDERWRALSEELAAKIESSREEVRQAWAERDRAETALRTL